jgi:hypothetical protein
MMVALDLGHRRERVSVPSRPRKPRARSLGRSVLGVIFTPEVVAAWLLCLLTALVFALVLALKDDPAAHAAAVDRALVHAEQSVHEAPACRLEDEWRAPC